MKPAKEWALMYSTDDDDAAFNERLFAHIQRDVLEAAAVVADRYHERDVARDIRALIRQEEPAEHLQATPSGCIRSRLCSPQMTHPWAHSHVCPLSKGG